MARADGTFEPVEHPAQCYRCGTPHTVHTLFPTPDGAPLNKLCDPCLEKLKAGERRLAPVKEQPTAGPRNLDLPLEAPARVADEDEEDLY